MSETIDVAVIGGGQSGLAAAWALRQCGRLPVVFEAAARPVGAWPHYYDSLELFSPARYSALPGRAFPGDPDRYPRRDEVIDYLDAYALSLDTDIRTDHRVRRVRLESDRYELDIEGHNPVRSRSLVAASGAFGQPHRPQLPALERFTGAVLHAADYREPTAFEGRRVVVVGAGNSAVQIAAELAQHARVTLATRAPVRFAPQRPFGRDLHFWLKRSGLDTLPLGPWLRRPPTMPVLDNGRYRAALRQRRPDRRALFVNASGDRLVWADGETEQVNTILLATGYRPALDYLANMGALGPNGVPQQRNGLSTRHPRLGFVGLEWQRSLASATLRGVGADAAYVAARLDG